MSAYISIVTPCYNAGKTIAMTIESVIAQTFSDWEMLIVDDCSTDNSAEIIKEYTKKDARVKYFQTPAPSGSPSMPRNIGIENASGKYIAFLDADDVWFNDKLRKELDFAERNHYQVVYSYYEKMDWDGKRNNRVVKTTPVSTYRSLLKSNAIPCLTSMVSREAIGETRFKHILQEDFCFWLDILKKGYKAYNICELTALYREAKVSRSSNKIDMFKGYWGVIRKQQNINLPSCCFYMITYTVLGFLKYLK
ncbi:MAG: glycosyltransferase [Muribaculaceae bacterium]|nr:glycosyltransferase [Muribaculaceae bacterium]